MARIRDWQSRLSDFLRERRSTPFAWGSNDCCLFAADGVLAMTGADPADGLRGYSTAKQATAILKREGGIRNLATKRFGPELPSVKVAGVGDVGLVETGGRLALALCGGMHWTGPGPDGLVVLPLNDARCAWRV